jgi:hypothetical protein
MVEVLSPGTAGYDKGRKFDYLRLLDVTLDVKRLYKGVTFRTEPV